ncbi:MAG: pitrilysin family protein [Gammaproteobacteria bacterium]|nr:pitrilysin family protein [Gammaproteobacteria bacterium]
MTAQLRLRITNTQEMVTLDPKILPVGVALSVSLAACIPDAPAVPAPVIPPLAYERYELANGLDVVLHVDRSDPVAAVAMTFHVGSAREVEGRTGFAHLFEHLLFLDSENVGPGGLDRLINRVGGSMNGTTNRDRTNYFEVVPADALEKVLWAESDRLGFFINTVSESVIAKEKEVVKNEKRQRVDNQPYGHADAVIDEALYPLGHPYRWQVIGSLGDLDAASLTDAREFHSRWYGPDNATLVVAGDLDVAQTKTWIEKYFGEIPARGTPAVPQPPSVRLAETDRLFHEDNFARLPELTLTWPTVALFHPDSYALNFLADVLAEGRATPLYEVLVEEEGLAPRASASNRSQELAGRFTIRVRAHAGVDLDDVYAAVESALARFEIQGVSADELERIRARTEARFYRGLESTLDKAFHLARYNTFAGSPGYGSEDIGRQLAVTGNDIVRVYDAYLRDRPFVATSFVPRGQAELVLKASRRAEVVEEPIVLGAEAETAPIVRGTERTPSVIDRTVEPPYGAPLVSSAPTVWGDTLSNGLTVLGVEDSESPLVRFELRMRGGHLLEDPDRTGVANLLAQTMTEGTANRTPAELEEAIDLLGATIRVSSGAETFVIAGSALARNFGPTMALLEEMLLEPRYDSEAFELARERVITSLDQRSANPNAIAQDVYGRLLYGEHILGSNPLGSPESVQSIEIDDLAEFHRSFLVPGVAAFHVVGDVRRGEVLASLATISERWRGGPVQFPEPPPVSSPGGLYFVDVPGASQSVLRIGHLALAESNPAFYPATVMNFWLGGSFSGNLSSQLREARGYTYGIRSDFRGSEIPGPFTISSGVRSNVTFEALQLIKDIVERYGPEFDAPDLDATQSYLLRANARAFERPEAKLRLLADMSRYGFPADYVLQREEVVREMTVGRVRMLAAEHLDVDRMVWLVVGDARTQLSRLRGLGLGEPVVLDREGRRP